MLRIFISWKVLSSAPWTMPSTIITTNRQHLTLKHKIYLLDLCGGKLVELWTCETFMKNLQICFHLSNYCFFFFPSSCVVHGNWCQAVPAQRSHWIKTMQNILLTRVITPLSAQECLSTSQSLCCNYRAQFCCLTFQLPLSCERWAFVLCTRFTQQSLLETMLC